MNILQQNDPASKTKAFNQLTGVSLLLLASAAVLAQSNGLTELPESYRTPLSDMIYEDNTDWRAAPEEENPWRENEDETAIKPRMKPEFFPKPDYSKEEDPTSRSLFQNEYELEKPRTNIFKYSF